MSIGIGIMIIGGLVAVLGLLLLKGGGGKTIAGIIIAVVGLAGLGVGYTMDQRTEVTYTVTEITAVSSRDTDNNYRVTLKAENGSETWIYVTDDQLISFPKDKQVTMTKSRLKELRKEKT